MRKLIPLTLMTALSSMALTGTASAAPRITAQSIIVNPVQTNVNVSVWTDRDPSGNAVPNYAPGEKIQLYVRADRDAYVYLFNVDPQGQVDMILPNGYTGGSNFVKANTTKVFPQPGAGFTFDIAAPYGLNKVLAVASTTQLNMNDIATFRTQNSFANVNVQGQQQLAQALSIVVNPVPQNTWTSDTAYYNVVARSTYVQPAPVRPAPVRPAPVRPAPVRPAPVRPAPVYSDQWITVPSWNATFTSQYSLQNVHEQYANQLRAQGYRLVTIREYSNTLRSEWTRGYGNYSRAVLDVRYVSGQVTVNITQR
ncbi:DUF4384 domain-containing protein [Deinococcus antarcticus]|uniref:DUF4384 domain-containing protein n=1 Tax=Deinococcus antarcticus TaxID=1298767 RepID=A0ABV8A671_9DEIO